MGHQTPLYDRHVALGARVVDFAGWSMPVQYSSIVEEHSAVRHGVGLFDISHMGRLRFEGPDALSLIQNVWTNDASTLKVGQVRYGLVCNDQGGIRDDVLVYRWPHGYSMVVNAGNREKIVSWLQESIGALKVGVVDESADTAMIAVQGPQAIALCKDLTDVDPSGLGYYFAAIAKYRGMPCSVSRTGYTGEDGVELVVNKSGGPGLWDELIRRGAKPCGLGARDTLRLEAAMPLYGHELSEEIDPFQAGLAWAVKLEKGPFRGREALRRRKEDASLRRRVGLELAGKRIAREGSPLKRDGTVVGVVCSGTFSPTLQKTIAMAYVDPAATPAGTALAVDVRGKDELATVTALPFYKRPK